jgi:hypothetical protein
MLTTLLIIIGVIVVAFMIAMAFMFIRMRKIHSALEELKEEESKLEKKPSPPKAKGSMVHFPLGQNSQYPPSTEAPLHKRVSVAPVMQHPARYLEKQGEEARHSEDQRKSMRRKIMHDLKEESYPKPLEALKRDTRMKAIYDLKKELKAQHKLR